MSGDHDHFAPIPPNANVTLCQDWFDKLEAAEHKYIDRENGFCRSPHVASQLAPSHKGHSDLMLTVLRYSYQLSRHAS